MLNMNYKKALLAATVLTAFCANAAFAADTPDKPTMRERVDNILHCEDRADYPDRPCNRDDRFGHRGGRHHRGDKRVAPPLTEEQIKEREARRAEWEKMTPEQRKEAQEKWRSERREAHKKEVAERMNKLTPEQRKEVENFIKKDREFRKDQRDAERKHRDEQRETLKDMTPEQRDAIRIQQPHRTGKPAPDHRFGNPRHHGDAKPLPPLEHHN